MDFLHVLLLAAAVAADCGLGRESECAKCLGPDGVNKDSQCIFYETAMGYACGGEGEKDYLQKFRYQSNCPTAIAVANDALEMVKESHPSPTLSSPSTTVDNGTMERELDIQFAPVDNGKDWSKDGSDGLFVNVKEREEDPTETSVNEGEGLFVTVQKHLTPVSDNEVAAVAADSKGTGQDFRFEAAGQMQNSSFNLHSTLKGKFSAHMNASTMTIQFTTARGCPICSASLSIIVWILVIII